MSARRLDTEKVRPYEHLSDGELAELADQAAELRLRMAMLNPGEVRETLIAHGCPANVAGRLVTNPTMKAHAARFHLDTQDALLGDPEALARMQHMEEGWARLRERGAPTSAEEALKEAELDRRYGR